MNNSDFEYLKLVTKEITRLFKFSKIDDWKTNDIFILSSEIQKVTGILISEKTISRIFNAIKKDLEYNPQIETKNALVKFIGYNNWLDFKKKNTIKNEKPENVILKTSKKVPIFKLLFFITSIVVGLILFILIKNNYSKRKLPFYSFSISNTENQFPFLIKIKYDFSQFKNYKVNLCKINIIDSASSLTCNLLNLKKDSVYEEIEVPGLYNYYIKVDNKIIFKKKIYSFSNSWLQSINSIKNKGQLTRSIPENGMIYTNLKITYDFDTSYNAFYSSFINYQKFPVSLDSFIFETRLKYNNSKWPIKKFITLTLIGENDFIRMLISNIYHNRNYIHVSEQRFKGDKSNFEKLLTDFSDWKVIKIISKNNHIEFYIEDDKKFECNYSKKMGKLYGISFKTHSFGSIDYVYLYNQNGKKVYADDFNN